MIKWSSFWGVIALSFSSHPLQASAPLYGMQESRVPHQFIVRFKDNTPRAADILRQAGIATLHAFQSSPSYLIQLDADREPQLLSSLQGEHEIAHIESNRRFRILSTPNDPGFTQQYHHKHIQSTEAWKVSTGDKSVVVAVIDSGVNYLHPDISPNYWYNPGETGQDAEGKEKSSNGIDDDGNGYIDDFRGWDFVNQDNDPMDDHGHGTHCAGVIGAKGNNGLGITGVNWDVSIVGLKFINGATGEGDTAGAVQAIEYATKLGIPILNNSWGGETDALPEAHESDVLRDAIQAAGEKGILFVAAAGNSRNDNDKRPTLPASYDIDPILAVAATWFIDSVAFYSNFGAESVDIAAPGTNILSTVLGTKTQKMTGTSMAAPVIAGAAALIKAARPDWTALEIKQHLMNTVEPTSKLTTKVKSGGYLNLARAMQDLPAK